jgi:MFS family permease
MNAPTWQAITSELVPASELTRAVTLNALPVNIGRAIGPALGGVLVAAAGPALVFALNAVSFVAVLVVVYRWRRASPRALLPAERVIGATRAGIRYACHAPPLIAVLVRLGLFIVCASAFWALLPVIARRDLGLGAFGYGLLLGCIGVGAIAGAALLPRVKRRLPLDVVIGLATVAFAVVSVLTAFWRFIPGLGIAMILGGVAWIAMMAGLNGSAQTAVPSWVRARALGIYLLVFQGGLGIGSALWGLVADHVGAPIALASAAGGALLGLAAIRRWPLRAVTTLTSMSSRLRAKARSVSRSNTVSTLRRQTHLRKPSATSSRFAAATAPSTGPSTRTQDTRGVTSKASSWSPGWSTYGSMSA